MKAFLPLFPLSRGLCLSTSAVSFKPSEQHLGNDEGRAVRLADIDNDGDEIKDIIYMSFFWQDGLQPSPNEILFATSEPK